MPSLFLSHGSPLIAIRDNDYTQFLHTLGKKLPRPDAILLFTAHWEADTLTLSAHDDIYETIYDFGGFPEEMYQITYPAKGSSKVAKLAQQQLAGHQISSKLDTVRGLDHGTWTLLTHLYPDADIPIVQASVNPYLPAAEQYKIGEALRGLHQHNILIIGSGSTVHNLGLLQWNREEPEEWATQFDNWLIEQFTEQDYNRLCKYEELAPYAKKAVPRSEHFVPLLIAAGSSLGETEVLFRDYELGNLSYLCFGFGLSK